MFKRLLQIFRIRRYFRKNALVTFPWVGFVSAIGA